jgi:glycosyltransferase involved in cell wall biosynthesis
MGGLGGLPAPRRGRGGGAPALHPTPAPLVCLLSAAHPAEDVRVVGKEGAALAAAGWRVCHVAPGDAPSGARHCGVAIETYRRRGGWVGRLCNVLSLARRGGASGAAVLHASEPDAWLAAILAARRSGARVVLDVHEHYPSRLDPRLPAWLRPLARGAIRALCRAAARWADAVVVVKDGLDADFAAPAKTVAVRNYAAAEAAPPPRAHRAGPATLVHLGAIGRARGWPQMLDALALCPPSTRLRLIGRFTDGSEADFAARAAALGLADRIERLGWMPYADALARAAECDIVWCCSSRVSRTTASPCRTSCSTACSPACR